MLPGRPSQTAQKHVIGPEPKQGQYQQREWRADHAQYHQVRDLIAVPRARAEAPALPLIILPLADEDERNGGQYANRQQTNGTGED